MQLNETKTNKLINSVTSGSIRNIKEKKESMQQTVIGKWDALVGMAIQQFQDRALQAEETNAKALKPEEFGVFEVQSVREYVLISYRCRDKVPET